MPQVRKRYDEAERPRPCEVVIPAKLAVYIYNECLERGYTETELVAHIVRQWITGLDEVSWKEVLKKLKKAERDAEGGSAARAG